MDAAIFTYGTIAVTAIISIMAFRIPSMAEENIFSTYYILEKHEYFRVVSSMFLHADWGHLLLNMFSFYSFSLSIELVYGFKTAALIYLLSGLGGGLLSLILNRKNMQYRALGASGAVSGTIFSSVFLIPGGSVLVFPLPIPIPSWAFAMLFVLASIYGLGRMSDNIGHDAHLGGALTGILVCALLYPDIISRQYILLAAIVIPTIIFFLLKDTIEKIIRR